MYIMYFANGANVSGSTKLEVTPVGGVIDGILERSNSEDIVGNSFLNQGKI